jgi:hypothetical protein
MDIDSMLRQIVESRSLKPITPPNKRFAADGAIHASQVILFLQPECLSRAAEAQS